MCRVCAQLCRLSSTCRCCLPSPGGSSSGRAVAILTFQTLLSIFLDISIIINTTGWKKTKVRFNYILIYCCWVIHYIVHPSYLCYNWKKPCNSCFCCIYSSRLSVFAGARWGVHLHAALRLCSLHPYRSLGGTWRQSHHQLRQVGLLGSHYFPD